MDNINIRLRWLLRNPGHACTMAERDYCEACDRMDQYDSQGQWYLEISKGIWRTATDKGLLDQLQGPGSVLVLYHEHKRVPEQLKPALAAATVEERETVLEMALAEQLNEYIDLICGMGITHGIFYSLMNYDGPTQWVVQCLQELDFSEGADVRPLLATRGDVVTLYPYIACCGELLYHFCSRETFELLFPIHSGADYYLERVISMSTVDVAYVRNLVDRGINRHRALGVAMDRLMHWILFSEEEQRELAHAYGVDYADAQREPAPEDAPALCFVRKLMRGTLTRRVDADLIASMKDLASAVEPLVPW